LGGIAVLFVLTLIGLWGYVELTSYAPTPQYVERVRQNTSITVTKHRKYYAIRPQTESDRPPLVYYPGGLVEPKAYVYKLAQNALELETDVYLIRPRFNLAIFDIGAAKAVLRRTDTKKIVVGGHSLGGAAACRFTRNNPEQVEGLFMFGAHCDKDVSELGISVVSLVGERDGMINRETYENLKKNLPPSTEIIEPSKLNHADFGNYGRQDGDAPSQLSEEETLDIIHKALREVYE